MNDFERDLLTENYFAAVRSTPRGYPHEVSANDYQLVTDALASIGYEVTKAPRIKDSWKILKVFEHPSPSPSAFRTTEKTGFRIEIALFANEIHLSCDISFGFELPSMDDRFWALFLDLITNHRGRYEIRQWPSGFASEAHEQEISKRRKSAVFSMIADFILISKHTDHEPAIGDLEFRSPWAGKWRPILPEIITIIEKSWRPSYMLYRPRYQGRIRLEKRARERFIEAAKPYPTPALI